jgi:putative ABC transport system ATP-binding protein
VGLGDRLDHRPSQLSGGQQQRVAIARVIAAQTPLILADEPTGSLDRESGLEVMELLEDLNHRGAALVLITHDRALADRAGRVLTMENGRLH